MGMGLQIVSTGLGAFSAWQEASASNKAAEYNAQNARAQAESVRTKGAFDLNLLKRDHKQDLSSLAQGLNNAGVETSSGTALKLLSEQSGLNERAQQIQKYNTDMEAYGYDRQASMYASQKRSPFMAAFTSLLGGVQQTYSQYQKYRYLTPAKSTTKANSCGYYL